MDGDIGATVATNDIDSAVAAAAAAVAELNSVFDGESAFEMAKSLSSINNYCNKRTAVATCVVGASTPRQNHNNKQLERSNSNSEYHPTNSTSLRNVSLLMREQDADLLESIHRSGANNNHPTGTTPLLTSRMMMMNDNSNIPLPPQLLLACSSCAADEEGEDSASSSLVLGVVGSSNRRNCSLNNKIPPLLSLRQKEKNEIVGECDDKDDYKNDNDESDDNFSSGKNMDREEPQQKSSSPISPSQASSSSSSPSRGKRRNQLLSFLLPPSNNAVVSGRSLLGSQHNPNDSINIPQQQRSSVIMTTLESMGGGSDNSIMSAAAAATAAASPTLEKPVNRRMLSGEVFEKNTHSVGENPSDRAALLLAEANKNQQHRSVSSTTEITGQSTNADNASLLLFDGDSILSNTLKRCESKERRMNEAAQFAEAVGDLPLTEQKSMRIIDYCDDEHAMIDDDDDDDDATEVHVHKRSSALLAKVIDVKTASPSDMAVLLAAPKSMIDDPLLPSLVAVAALVAPETPVKTRPQWPSEHFQLTTRHGIETRHFQAGFLAQLPSSLPSSTQDFVYKGIRANPPDIVKRGTTRGNYALLHRKAWLEVSDKYHRYGKNLRLYYRFWESLGCPTNMFFDWLDSKGEAAGQPLPELSDCPRSQLDSDTVLYITNQEVTQGYALRFVVDDKENEAQKLEGDPSELEQMTRGRVVDVDGDPVRTGIDGWIFVLRDNVFYGAQKITSVSGHSKQRFHHSSFFGGKAVAAAGIFITDDDGYLTKLYPHSGHYRPGEAHMQRVLFHIYHEGVDLCSFEIDTQQIQHVARESEGVTKVKEKKIVSPEGKKKKIESLHLMPAVLVACFLAHKARFIGEGVFSRIHHIRKTNVASVTEALVVIDNGGYWRKNLPNLRDESQ